jgi:hypothetical protein
VEYILKQSKPKLLIDFCDSKAAKYACENWHYSKCMPIGKMITIGIWEDEKFIGVIIFSRGACPWLGSQFSLDMTQLCELTRVAIKKGHFFQTSKYLGLAIKILKKRLNKLELIFSYADSRQNHHGGIYQATNWIYLGLSKLENTGYEYFTNDKWTHERAILSKYGSHTNALKLNPSLKFRKKSNKHKYILPLINKEKYIKLNKKYPKRIEHENNASVFHTEEGGATPTDALQSHNKTDDINQKELWAVKK